MIDTREKKSIIVIDVIDRLRGNGKIQAVSFQPLVVVLRPSPYKKGAPVCTPLQRQSAFPSDYDAMPLPHANGLGVTVLRE